MRYYKNKTTKAYRLSNVELDKNWEEITQEQYESVFKPSPKALIKREINQLKKLLQESDYKAIKYAEGLISESDYQETKEQRQSYRDRINELENVL